LKLKITLLERIQLSMVEIRPRANGPKASGPAARDTSIVAELPALVIWSTPAFGDQKEIGIGLDLSSPITFAASDPVMMMPRAQSCGAKELSLSGEVGERAQAQLLLKEARSVQAAAVKAQDAAEAGVQKYRGVTPTQADTQSQTDPIPGLPPLSEVLSNGAARDYLAIARKDEPKKKKGGGLFGGMFGKKK